MKTIILASNNQHEIKEFKEILKNFNILSLEDIGFLDEIEETGTTFLENSLLKAQAVHKFLKEHKLSYYVIADDSGLCVDALGGAPGVYSARYGGDHNSQANRDKLLNEMQGKTNRNAYFVCGLVFMRPDGSYAYLEGKTFGKITDREIGDTSFGFDPLFLSDDLGKTFGEVSKEDKNKVSHRKRAIDKLLELLEREK